MKRSQSTRSPKYREYLEPLKDPDDAERPPLKKRRRKSTIRVDSNDRMEFVGLQTPHPTLESQSQTFKLPSSSPKASPRTLSPVPGLLPSAVSSKHFKENAPKSGNVEAASASWNRHPIPKPFAARMHMSGGIPAIPLSRKTRSRSGRHPSRSHSRSSSNSNVSSRANSKEPRARAPKPHNLVLQNESKLKHAQSLSSLNDTKSNHHEKPKANPSSRKSKQSLLPLASPFVSRASSPVEQDSGAHIPTQMQVENGNKRKSSTRSALGDITLDPNLPRQVSSGKHATDTQSHRTEYGWHHNVQHSFEKATTTPHTANPKKINLIETTTRKVRPGSKAATEKLIYAQNKTQEHERERRPSAPSSLHLPKEIRQTGRLSVLGPSRSGNAASRSPAKDKRGRVDEAEIDQPRTKVTSGVHVFLDKVRRLSPKGGEVIPPTPAVEATENHVLRAALIVKPPARKVLPSKHLHPSASMDDLHAGTSQAHHVADMGKADNDDDRTAWMHTRSNVDFNRPPSQMEVSQAIGVGFGFADFEETFCTLSEDENASEGEVSSGEHERKRDAQARRISNLSRSPRELTLRPSDLDQFWPHHNLDLGLELGTKDEFGFGFGFEDIPDGRGLGTAFGDDALGVSTPVKDLLPGVLAEQREEVKIGAARRMSSLPSLHKGLLKRNAAETHGGVRATALARSISHDGLRDCLQQEEDGEKDMELTGSGIFSSSDDADNMDTWITDSLISPPTLYLARKERAAEAHHGHDEDDDQDIQTIHCKSSSTLDGPSYHSAGQGKNHDPEDEELSEAHTHSSSSGKSDRTTTTRTRSGTIVIANPSVAAASTVPPGARRTRSGTIVGPLPTSPPPTSALPPRPDGSRVGSAPTRTRSGTIVASSSVPRPIDSGTALGTRGRMRSGSVVKLRPGQNQALGNVYGRQRVNDRAGEVGEDDGVECYVDSLYVPAQESSSPDPIDFLRFADIAEAEDEENEEWRIARDPPSPDVRKGKLKQRALRGLAGKWLTRGGKTAPKGGGRKGLKARFVGDGGVEEDDEDVLGDAEDSSDDELLLCSRENTLKPGS